MSSIVCKFKETIRQPFSVVSFGITETEGFIQEFLKEKIIKNSYDGFYAIFDKETILKYHSPQAGHMQL